MTVLENLEMGCYGRKFASKAEHKERLDWVFETFPRLAERRSQVGGTLSGGEQQMLAIGRALMARPRVLLLDEPSMGLAPMVISQIFQIIAEINAQGTTVLLVEQNAQQALTRSDRAYILETGEITRDGHGARAVGRRQHSRRLPRRRLSCPVNPTRPVRPVRPVRNVAEPLGDVCDSSDYPSRGPQRPAMPGVGRRRCERG